MSRFRFRPEVQVLEAREVPALNLLYTGTSLTLTGTPTALGDLPALRVTGDGHDNFKITDGALNLGTYHVTQDIRVRLASFDTNVYVVLGGDTLRGGILVDLGAGDTNPATTGRVVLGNTSGAAHVGGDVTFRGGSGQESFRVAAAPGTTVDIGGSLRVLGNPVTTPIEDSFTLDQPVEVHGDLTTSRITYTTINGTVDRDVTANAADSPGGMGFAVYGTVHGDVSATGGATAGPDWYSYTRVYGTVDGDLTVRFTAGGGPVTVFGTVGGDVRVTQTDAGASRSTSVNLFGAVGGDTVVRVANPLFFDFGGETDGDVTVSTTGAYTSMLMEGVVHGDFRFTAGSLTTTDAQIVGAVDGSAVIDLGGSAATFAGFTMFGIGLFEGDGRVGGNLSIKSRSGTTAVWIGSHNSFTDENGNLVQTDFPAIVGGDLKVDLGGGVSNTFVFDGEGKSKVGGKLSYTGGSGADAVTILGQNTFKATIKTGGGDDSVVFAPDASLGSLDLDFGKGPGTKTWGPPSVISFPVKLKNLS